MVRNESYIRYIGAGLLMAWHVKKKKKSKTNPQSIETITHWKQTLYTSTTPQTQVTSATFFEKNIVPQRKPKEADF